MSAQDFFYIAVSVAFVILAGFFSYAAFELIRLLKSLRRVTDAIGKTTDDINALKEGLKTAIIKIAGNVVKSKAKRRWLK